MSRLIVAEFMTLDGVMEAPGFEEHPDGKNAWALSRALAEAGGHETVVTRTVRDLATGTDLNYRPRGSVGLRGVPGQWELFEASSA